MRAVWTGPQAGLRVWGPDGRPGSRKNAHHSPPLRREGRQSEIRLLTNLSAKHCSVGSSPWQTLPAETKICPRKSQESLHSDIPSQTCVKIHLFLLRSPSHACHGLARRNCNPQSRRGSDGTRLLSQEECFLPGPLLPLPRLTAHPSPSSGIAPEKARRSRAGTQANSARPQVVNQSSGTGRSAVPQPPAPNPQPPECPATRP